MQTRRKPKNLGIKKILLDHLIYLFANEKSCHLLTCKPTRTYVHLQPQILDYFVFNIMVVLSPI